MNSVILTGRLTRDPETKYTASGKNCCNFTLAVRKNKDEADFINCVAFGKTAENIAQYMSKGKMLGIQGSIHNNNYTDDEGHKRSFTSVIANTCEFLESKNQNSELSQNAPYTEMDVDEDVLPF